MKIISLQIKVFALLIFVFCFFFSEAQQSILLVSGKRVYVKETKIDSSGLILYKNKHGKIRAFEMDEVFSLERKDSVEIIFYKPACSDVCFKVNQMRDYLHGLADGYEKKMWFPMTGNFILGMAAGGILPPYLSPLAPVVFSGTMGLIKPKSDITGISSEYLNNEHYIVGYKESVKKKRILSSIAGGTVGLVVGIVVGSLLLK